MRLLVDGNGVRSTSVRHSRGGVEERWPSWAPAHLIRFIEVHLAHIAQPGGRHDPPTVSATGGTESAPARVVLHAHVEPAAPRAGASFDICLTLRVDGRALPPWGSLDYHAAARVDPVPGTAGTENGNGFDTGGGTGYDGCAPAVQRHPPLRAEGAVFAPSAVIHLTCPGLPAGRYRLDAAISLRIPGFRRPVGVAGAGQVTVEIRGR